MYYSPLPVYASRVSTGLTNYTFILTKYQFCSILQKNLSFCEVQFHIRSHSFRIGRATDLAKNGVDENIIKQYGRWKSSSYLRNPFLSPGIIIFIFRHVLSNTFCFLPDLMY
jgi:hypothetical protein